MSNSIHSIRTLFTRHDHTIYTYKNEAFSVSDIWASSAALKRVMPERGERIGVAVHSPFLLLCCLITAWEKGVIPILLDPSFKKEIDLLVDDQRGLSILLESGTNADWEARSVVIEAIKAKESHDYPLVVPDAETVCCAFLTSGSEGYPKVVYKKTRQLFKELDMLSRFVAQASPMNALSFVPSFHIYGFLFGVMLPLIKAGTSHYVAEKHFINLADEIQRIRPDLIVASPVQYKYILDGLKDDQEFLKMRFFCSGAPLSDEFLELFFTRTGCTIKQIYGSTETGGIAYYEDQSIWKPLPQVQVRCDPRTGLISVQSPWSSFEGESDWEETSDVGELIRDGFVLLGRAGNLIKYRGKRMSSCEIERVLTRFSSVTDAVIIAHEHSHKEQLYAFLVLARDCTLDEHALRTFCAQQLADYKIPKKFIVLETIPRTPNGKIDFQSLRTTVENTTVGP
ncbi:acyl--CoA ligase [bacterium]|nr:acyl--CoA ligase [bacterium]